MKRIIIAVLAASTAAVVYAQAETPEKKGRAGDFRAEMRTLIEGDGMKVDDLANLMQTRAQARFAALDADSDGIVTKDEYLAATTERAESRFERMNPDENGIVKRSGREGWGRHHRGPRHEMRGERNPEQRAERQSERIAEQFARFDKDGDGSISKEEFETAMTERGDQRAARAERRGGMPQEMRGMHRQMRALMREGMNLEAFTKAMQERATARFETLDGDGNGELTAAEFTANVAERAQHAFARMDRDDDGVVTRDDRPRRGGGKHHGPRGRD